MTPALFLVLWFLLVFLFGPYLALIVVFVCDLVEDRWPPYRGGPDVPPPPEGFGSARPREGGLGKP